MGALHGIRDYVVPPANDMITFTLTLERVQNDDGDIWVARIAEFPDVRGFETDPYEAAIVAIDAAICLSEGLT